MRHKALMNHKHFERREGFALLIGRLINRINLLVNLLVNLKPFRVIFSILFVPLSLKRNSEVESKRKADRDQFAQNDLQVRERKPS